MNESLLKNKHKTSHNALCQSYNRQESRPIKSPLESPQEGHKEGHQEGRKSREEDRQESLLEVIRLISLNKSSCEDPFGKHSFNEN